MAKTTDRTILLSGSLSSDIIIHYPGEFSHQIADNPTRPISLSFLVDSLSKTDGGTGANIAYSLALLGKTSTLLTSVGPDAGEYVKKLGKMGVDVSHLIKSAKTTSTFVGMTDAEGGQIGSFLPGAMEDSITIGLDPWFGTDAIVVVSAHEPGTMHRHVAEAHKLGLTLVYDVGQQATNSSTDDLNDGIAAADILMLNDTELAVLAKRLGRTESEIRNEVPLAVVTLGSQGSIIYGKELPNPISIPVVPNITMVDPTGAGDAYRSGFLFGYAKGMDLQICGRLGSVTASFAIEHAGTQIHTFTMNEFNSRYKQTYGELYE